MLKAPLITVMLPVYNASKFIEECLDSLLRQTYSHFQCLVIDDASTDNSVTIIQSYKDSRINLIVKPKNTGYTDSLNMGLNLAKGKYIARMDADDVCDPERFEKQIAFLESHPEVILCGTNYSIYGTDKLVAMPETFTAIKTKLLKATAFGHPTVMMRASIFNKHSIAYDCSKEPAEDYALWVRLLKYGRMYNIQESLLRYRLHANQVSETKRQKQLLSKLETRVNILNYLEVPLSQAEKRLLKVIINNRTITFQNLKGFLALRPKLLTGNKNEFFEEKAFKDYLIVLEKEIIEHYFIHRTQFYPKLIVEYAQLLGSLKYRLTMLQTLKMGIKSIVQKNKVSQ